MVDSFYILCGHCQGLIGNIQSGNLTEGHTGHRLGSHKLAEKRFEPLRTEGVNWLYVAIDETGN